MGDGDGGVVVDAPIVLVEAIAEFDVFAVILGEDFGNRPLSKHQPPQVGDRSVITLHVKYPPKNEPGATQVRLSGGEQLKEMPGFVNIHSSKDLLGTADIGEMTYMERVSPSSLSDFSPRDCIK